MADINKDLNPEEVKKFVVDLMVPECKDVANSFFNCVETKISSFGNNENMEYVKLEKQMQTNIVPGCMKKFNLESCLDKYDKH